jgi:hypothetical protein
VIYIGIYVIYYNQGYLKLEVTFCFATGGSSGSPPRAALCQGAYRSHLYLVASGACRLELPGVMLDLILCQTAGRCSIEHLNPLFILRTKYVQQARGAASHLSRLVSSTLLQSRCLTKCGRQGRSASAVPCGIAGLNGKSSPKSVPTTRADFMACPCWLRHSSSRPSWALATRRSCATSSARAPCLPGCRPTRRSFTPSASHHLPSRSRTPCKRARA